MTSSLVLLIPGGGKNTSTEFESEGWWQKPETRVKVWALSLWLR